MIQRLSEALNRVPVRWRLALVSASLTAVILIAFALVVGNLARSRIRADFDSDLRASALKVGGRLELANFSDYGRIEVLGASKLEDFARPIGASIRVVTRDGRVLAGTTGSPSLGRVDPGVHRLGDLHVATVRLPKQQQGTPVAFVQYARSSADIENTIGRVWLFLLFGVVGGIGFATVAGLAIAHRAMQPIADLTATAREIARTRDPSRRLPEPEADDEVGELARTLQQMLESLDEAKSETEEAMERQRAFVADASHELRTPLTSILANLEILEEGLRRAPREGEPEIVQAALRSSRRMSRLVGDLLLLARADTGRQGDRVDRDLGDIAREAAVEVTPMLGDRTLDTSGLRQVTVNCNPDDLHRLAVNLLENAASHTPPGAKIWLSTATESDHAVLRVADDGPGIDDELADHVFDRFVRGLGDSGGGAGLGLAIVSAVARSHGGQVQIGRSAAGGAELTVLLPSAGDRNPSASADQVLGAT